jgi:hypothetical protein
MSEEDDFLERHADAIEIALLKKRLEETYAQVDLCKIQFPHSGEWIRTLDAHGKVTLSYPPNKGYDDAKDEALRMLDDDQWKLSLWEAKHHWQTRRLYLLYFTVTIAGFVAINSTWMRFLISVAFLIVLHGYLWFYGYRFEISVTRIRSHIRSRFQNKI